MHTFQGGALFLHEVLKDFSASILSIARIPNENLSNWSIIILLGFSGRDAIS